MCLKKLVAFFWLLSAWLCVQVSAQSSVPLPPDISTGYSSTTTQGSTGSSESETQTWNRLDYLLSQLEMESELSATESAALLSELKRLQDELSGLSSLSKESEKKLESLKSSIGRLDAENLLIRQSRDFFRVTAFVGIPVAIVVGFVVGVFSFK